MKYLCIYLIKFYQRFISPLKPPCCRFRPTCSSYAIEAFREWGFIIGFALTVCAFCAVILFPRVATTLYRKGNERAINVPTRKKEIVQNHARNL